MIEPLQDSREESNVAVRELDDRLYGKLLEVNAALKDAGGMLIFLYAILLLAACSALWFEWYQGLWFLQGADLNSIWIYLLVFVVVFLVWIAHFEFVQWWCYRRNRSELLYHIQRSDMGRYQLLAAIAHDKLLSQVAEALQRDRWDEAEFQVSYADARSITRIRHG
jgi:hypothetical protein